MTEFFLLIRNELDSKSSFSAEQNRIFLIGCEAYIERLKKNGNLISAHPMIRAGIILSGTHGQFEEKPFNETNEVIFGYYHILANDLEEAKELAKGNPEFAFTKTCRIEIRPLKAMEEETAYVYTRK